MIFTFTHTRPDGHTITTGRVLAPCTNAPMCSGEVHFGTGCEPSFWDDMDTDMVSEIERIDAELATVTWEGGAL
jgi:hypothetical protein